MPPFSHINSSILPATLPMVRFLPLNSFLGTFGSSPSLDLHLPPPISSIHRWALLTATWLLPNKGLATDDSHPTLPDDLRERPESRDARAVALNA